MILIFESLNGIFDNYFYLPPYDGLRIKAKNELSINPKNKFDFIVLGDCYPLLGIIPKIIEDRTGLSGFNFSTHVVYSIFSSYCYFKNYLMTCAKKPKYVVISFLPMSCSLTKADIEKDSLGVFYDFKDHNQASLVKEFGLNAIPLMLPSLKHQYLFNNFSTIPSSLISLKENSNQVAPFIQDVFDKKGRDTMVEDNIYLVLKDTDDYTRFNVSPFFDKYLRAMLDLADKNNIKVIYIIPTHPLEIYKKEKEWGNTEAYFEYLTALQKQGHHLIILEPQDNFDQMFSYSGDLHLNFWGALNLSDVLAGKIAELEK